MCPLEIDVLSVTFDPETVEVRLLIMTQHLVGTQPSKLRHL